MHRGLGHRRAFHPVGRDPRRGRCSPRRRTGSPWPSSPPGWCPTSPAILIDIGIDHDRPDPDAPTAGRRPGRSDTERLQTGELVYAGVRRTPIHALATELPFRGVPTGLAAELFASTLDVYLILGDIAPESARTSPRPTAARRPLDAARDRLARMIGADRESFSTEDARDFAARPRIAA